MIESGYYVRQELGRSEIVYCTPNSQAQINDFRKQLAEIRPLIGDRQSLDVTNTEISEKPEAFGLREEVSGYSTPEDLMLRRCIERLPRHGRIESFDKHTDSGKIRGDGLRLQSSTRLRYNKTRGTRDLRNLYIVYAVGLTKPEGRKQVVQWALIDDIPWPNCKIPSSQTQLNNIRIKLLRPYNLESLIACLSADWYEGFEKRKEKSYLADDALKTVLYEAIHALPEGKFRFEKIREALQVSRYSFLNQWDLEAGEQAPEFLMRMLSAQQLVALGSPRHQWMVSVHQDTKPQLIEWALRAELRQKREEMWKEELNRDFTWDAKIASSLLKSDWQPTTLGLDWIQNLTRKGRIASSHIVRRMKANPGEASHWMGCLANEQG